MSKLSDDEVMEIVDELRVHHAVKALRHEYSYAEIAKRHGVSHNYVYLLANGAARQDLLIPLQLKGDV